MSDIGMASEGATGALSGAATGAALGSVVPGIGTATGAIVGGAIGLVGGLLGGSAKKKAAKAARRAAKFKATILEGNADEVLRTAAINNERLGLMLANLRQKVGFNLEAISQDVGFTMDAARRAGDKIRRNYNKVRGAQFTAIAGSGITTGGSAGDVMRDTELDYEYAFLDEMQRGVVEATRLQNQANLIKFEGEEKAEDFVFRQKETLRQGEIQAKNLRQEAKLVVMAGNAQASSISAQSAAQSIDNIMTAANTYYSFKK